MVFGISPGPPLAFSFVRAAQNEREVCKYWFCIYWFCLYTWSIEFYHLSEQGATMSLEYMLKPAIDDPRLRRCRYSALLYVQCLNLLLQ